MTEINVSDLGSLNTDQLRIIAEKEPDSDIDSIKLIHHARIAYSRRLEKREVSNVAEINKDSGLDFSSAFEPTGVPGIYYAKGTKIRWRKTENGMTCIDI